jgi:sirohydrochlorin cobaltochelatase
VVTAVYQNTALVVLGHGTELNPDSATAVLQHAEAIRRRGLLGAVWGSFWKQEPRLLRTLEQIQQDQIVIVPFFLSDGYFSNVVIPRELGLPTEAGADGIRKRNEGSRTIYYTGAIGADPRIATYIRARAREVTEQFPFPRAPRISEVTLFLAGHGTPRNANSRKAAEQHAAAIRGEGDYAAVHTVFLEESPRIPEVYSIAESRYIVVVPFFTSDGLHTREDIPTLLGEPERLVRARAAAGKPTWRNPTERNGRLVWCSRAVGSAPGMPDLILEKALGVLGKTTANS